MSVDDAAEGEPAATPAPRPLQQQPQQRPQGRASFLEPLSLILASRLGLFLLAYLGLVLIQGPHKPGNAIPGNLFLDGWVRWDAFWYARAAQHGYTNVPIDESGQRDTGQLPAFAFVVRAATHVIPDVYVAGVVVSNLCFVIAGVVLFRLVSGRFGDDVARRTLVLLCVYPFSYTFSAMYTESLFVLCAVCAFAFAERRWWPLAGLCAAAAGATRVVGTATALALVVMYFDQRRWRWRDARWIDLVSLLIGFGGIVAFVLYLAIKFHDPWVFVRVHRAEGWDTFNNLHALRDTLHAWATASFGNVASGNVPVLATIHILVAIVALALCATSWRKLPAGYATFGTLVIVVSLYRWACIGRHASTAFPIFIAAAILLDRSPRVYHGVIYFSTILLAILTILFTQGFWVA